MQYAKNLRECGLNTVVVTPNLRSLFHSEVAPKIDDAMTGRPVTRDGPVVFTATNHRCGSA